MPAAALRDRRLLVYLVFDEARHDAFDDNPHVCVGINPHKVMGVISEHMDSYAVLFVSARAVTKGATTQALGDAITVVMAEAVGRLDQTPMESVTRTVGNRTVSGLASTAAGLLMSVYPTE